MKAAVGFLCLPLEAEQLTQRARGLAMLQAALNAGGASPGILMATARKQLTAAEQARMATTV